MGCIEVLCDGANYMASVCRDGLGRKTKDVVQVGSEFIKREYKYYDGKVTDEHLHQQTAFKDL